MPTNSSSAGLTRGTRGIVLLVSAVVAVALDQASKVHATIHWKNAPPLSFFGDLFRIDYAENHGAFLSLLANMPDEVRFWILTVINGAVLIGLAIYLLAARSISWMTFLPLMLVVVGGIGNLIDRIRFGYVIDFLNLGVGGLRTGIFNIADMAITAGFILMAIPLFFGDGKPQTEQPTPVQPSPGKEDEIQETVSQTGMPEQEQV